MTREEIISGLKFTVEMFLLDPNTGEAIAEPRNDMDKTTIDACKGAIELLEQEPSGDVISRQDAIKAIDEKAKRIKNEDTLNGLAGAVGILFDLPPVKPQPCEGAISRQAAIDAIYDHEYKKDMRRAIEDLPFVNPQEPKYCDRNICMANEYNGIGCDECEVTKSKEPSGDVVSRQWLMRKATEKFYTTNYFNHITKMIEEAPSVKPQLKTGHWKRISMDKYTTYAQYWYRCDRCGKDNLGNTDWCPNCGCRMVEPQEMNEKISYEVEQDLNEYTGNIEIIEKKY